MIKRIDSDGTFYEVPFDYWEWVNNYDDIQHWMTQQDQSYMDDWGRSIDGSSKIRIWFTDPNMALMFSLRWI